MNSGIALNIIELPWFVDSTSEDWLTLAAKVDGLFFAGPPSRCSAAKSISFRESFETRSPRKVDVNLIFKLQICHILSHTIASFG